MVKATKKMLAAAAMAAAGLGLSGSAMAGTVDVSYVLQNLGGGLYEYDYTFANNSLSDPLIDIIIDFDAALYQFSSLSQVGSVADWTGTALVPLPGVPAGFEFFTTGLGIAPGNQLGGFAVQFRWLGPGAPGAQSFSVYNATFDVVASGRTTDAGTPPPPGVPEPQSLALVMLALTAATAAARRGASRPAG